jgi:hypothetical protein
MNSHFRSKTHVVVLQTCWSDHLTLWKIVPLSSITNTFGALPTHVNKSETLPGGHIVEGSHDRLLAMADRQ